LKRARGESIRYSLWMRRRREGRARLGQIIGIEIGALTALGTVGGCGTSPDGGFNRAVGGASSSASCTTGDTRACVGPAQCRGGQLCDEKNRWGACDCGTTNGPLPDAGAGQGGSGGTSGGGVGGGVTPTLGAAGLGVGVKGLAGAPGTGTPGLTGVPGTPIGRSCRTDADCGGGKLFCLTSSSSSSGLGGPPNGLCVADCTLNTAACASIDPLSVCVAFSAVNGKAYCLEGCTVGASSSGTKCHDRPDLACDDSTGNTPGDGLCVPSCRGDADCGARKCDLGTGFCNDSAVLGGTLPAGSSCDPQAATDRCQGACLPLDSAGTTGMCGGLCTLGIVGCGEDPASTAPLAAACLFDATVLGKGDTGDIGLCGALCDCDAQCPAKGTLCRPFEATLQSGLGRAGYCGVANAAGAPVDHLATCPN
jgi:hypothetical protein